VTLLISTHSTALRTYRYAPTGGGRVPDFDRLFLHSSLQLSLRQRWDEMLKKVLLGVAFLFWGGETILPSSPMGNRYGYPRGHHLRVDLGLIIVEHLRRTGQQTPSKTVPFRFIASLR